MKRCKSSIRRAAIGARACNGAAAELK